MELFVGLVLIMPALISLLVGFFYMLQFNRSQKGSTLVSHIQVSLFGPFLLGASKVLSEQSKRYLRNFYISGVIFVGYLSLLMLFM